MNRSITLTLATVLLAHSGCEKFSKQDTLDYEIYALKGDQHRELLASGRIKSDGKNVLSVEQSAWGSHFWNKSVPLWKEWTVGACVYREKQLDGFGLWIRDKGSGFSWDWFTRESGLTYRKLQGDGHVTVTLAPTQDYEEIVAIDFLDDITLRGNFGWLPYWETHHVLIKKGSVLRLAP